MDALNCGALLPLRGGDSEESAATAAPGRGQGCPAPRCSRVRIAHGAGRGQIWGKTRVPSLRVLGFQSEEVKLHFSKGNLKKTRMQPNQWKSGGVWAGAAGPAPSGTGAAGTPDVF